MDSMELLAVMERAIRAVREDEVAEIEIEHTVTTDDECAENTTITVRAEVGRITLGLPGVEE